MPKIAVGNSFLQNADSNALLRQPKLIGELHEIDAQTADSHKPQAYYSHPHGTLWLGDSLLWLDSLEPESVDMIFADPPYNLGKADWDHFESHDEYIRWSLRWIELASRVLKPTGSLFVCGFSEILADIRRPAAPHFHKCRWLIWSYKNKANMSKDWGRSHESILHFRKSRNTTFNIDDVRVPYGKHTLKYPLHPQAESSQYGNGKKGGNWRPHPHGAKPRDVFEIPVVCNGMKEKTPHPTQKPEELLRRIVLSSSNEGDLVIDPFSGSGTTLVCAEQLNRRWLGCDINEDYNSWAVMRLQNIPRQTVRAWIDNDHRTAQRRKSIRQR